MTAKSGPCLRSRMMILNIEKRLTEFDPSGSLRRHERILVVMGRTRPRPKPAVGTRRYFEELELVESVEIACSANEAWLLVVDVTGIGEFSTECMGVRWLGGASLHPLLLADILGGRLRRSNRADCRALASIHEVHELGELHEVRGTDTVRMSRE